MRKHLIYTAIGILGLMLAFVSCGGGGGSSNSGGGSGNQMVAVTGVTLNKQSTTLTVGNTETLMATVQPNNATNKNVSWSSSNTNVATVVSGLVTAIAQGSVSITVTTQDGNRQAACYVTVNAAPVPVTGVRLDKDTITLPVGDWEQLTETILPSDASNKNVTWSSSNVDVAYVHNNGEVSALSPGTASITVKSNDGNHTASCSVTVFVPIPVTSVSLNKNTMTLSLGGSEQLIETVLPANATNKSVTWSIPPTLPGETPVVSVNSNGLVAATGPGNTVVSVRTDDGNFMASCIVTVIVPVTGVTLNKGTMTLAMYDSVPLFWNGSDDDCLLAEVLPLNATNKSVSWSSSDNTIVRLNNSWLTALAPGEATITVITLDGSYTATCNVEVITEYDVYVAGYENIVGIGYVATLWKNGIPQYLSNYHSQALSVFVSDGDVYVAGYESNPETGMVAMLWKNGIPQYLNDTSFPINLNSRAEAVYVSGSDVYVAGYENIWNGSSIINVATLWKNSIPQRLSGTEWYSSSYAYSVFVSDSDVYVAGRESVLMGDLPTIWKNGVPQRPISDLLDYPYSVFVSGGDVYVAGRHTYLGIGGLVATLWKNGNLERLSDTMSYAESVFVSDSDVFVAGRAPYATLWKNGIPQNLYNGTSCAYSVFVLSGDVYVAGYEYEYATSKYIATLWRNGVRQRLSDRESRAFSVFIK